MFPLAAARSSDTPHRDFTEMFPVKLKFGQWYIAALCSNCKTLTVLLPDASNGQSELNGSYFMRCPRCKQVGDYDAQHYRHKERRRGLRIQIL